MDKAAMERMLINVVYNVFSTTFFSLVEECPDPPCEECDDVYHGVIEFNNGEWGILNVVISHSFARNVTMDFLGKTEDEPIEEPEIADVCGEITNIIGGDISTKLSDLTGEYLKLSIPKVERRNQCPHIHSEDTNHITVFFQNVHEDKFFVHLAVRRETLKI